MRVLRFGFIMVEFLEPRTETVEAGYPLAPLQEGMLVESGSTLGAGVNLTQVICGLPEEIDADHFRSAWQQVIERHSVLRNSFHWDKNGAAKQVPHQGLSVPFSVIDLTRNSDAKARVQMLLAEERRNGFNPALPPLMRLTLVRYGAANYELIWTFHHLIIDGRSITILLNEAFGLYQGLIEGRQVNLPEPVPYAKFIEWLPKSDTGQTESFWRNHLKSFAISTPLPVSHHSFEERSAGAENGEQERTISVEDTRKLRRFAKKADVTLNTIMQAAWALLLSRYSGEDDVVFGAVRAGRRNTVPGADSIPGVFINTVPVRVRLSSESSLRVWLKELREQWIALRPYEHTSLTRIHTWSEAPKGRRLFETVINVQDPSWSAALKAQGALWSRREFRIINQPAFPLALDVYADEETLLKLVYDPARFDPSMIRRMLGHLDSILTGFTIDAEQAVSNIRLLLPEEERELLVEWNKTACEFPSTCVHKLFEQQAARTPHALALASDDAELSYGELNARADALARNLHRWDVHPETLVAVVMDRSVEMVISALAVLKAGGAYVPMDPNYPKERLFGMLQETSAPVLLTQTAHLGSLPVTSARVVCVDQEPFETLGEGSENGSATPTNLAYVIYTSGSTGRPKGVEIEHRGLTNLVHWHQSVYNVAASDRATQLASPAFDAAVWEIWPYLAFGASIHIPNETTRISPSRLVAWLVEKRITFSFLPTPLAEEVLREEWPATSALKVLLTGGDRLRRQPEARMPFSLVNHYGPTENSVVTTWYRVPVESGLSSAPPIGRPIANTQIFVLDQKLRPVPVGIPGELFVTGTGLARGYLNQPQVTSERFISNPFDATGRSRLYRTGDLVRYLPDGELEYIGRNDQQVKVRGFRVETAEIEVCLNRHPDVRQCAVVTRDDSGETYLAAYVVPVRDQELDASSLRSHLHQMLPSYMVPAVFVGLDELPLTPNGKLDRAVLPAPQSNGANCATPRTETESLIAGIWSELLGKERPPLDITFFELGGHSLLAARAIARLEALFGVEVSLNQFFRTPTVAGLAHWLEANRPNRKGSRGAIAKQDPALPPTLSFAQERLWFMERLQPGLPLNNIPLGICIHGPLQSHALKEALSRLVARHESFRTSFHGDKGRPVATVHAATELPLDVVDLGALTPIDRQAEVTRISTEEARRPFNLEESPLLRVKLLRLGADEHVLLITTHHIASDGWSVGIFYKELAAIYDSICHNRPDALETLPVTYGDYAAWQREALQGIGLDRPLSYWQKQLEGASTVLELPTDRPRPSVQSYRGMTRHFAMPKALMDDLQALAQREDVTIFMLLLAVFQTLLHRYSGQDDLLVGSPVAGRAQIQSESLVGLFLNNLVFRASFPAHLPFRDLLRQTRTTALDAYAHQELPFEKLVESLHLPRDLSRSPLFQVMFVLQNTPLQPLNLTGLTLVPLALDSGTAKYDLTLGLEPDGWSGYLEYSTDLFSEPTIGRMLGHFQTLLESIVQQPDSKIANLSLLTPGEKKQLLLEWNATKSDFPRQCIHELFEAQAARTPEKVALVFEEQELTYLELNCRANTLAHHLRSMGVGPDVPVGICVKRSLQMMVALLAIQKAGGAYVPLDPTYPAERLAFMLEDSAAPVLIMQEGLSEKLNFPAARIVVLEPFFSRPAPTETEQNPASGATPENLAYVIYTSGSTGKPKGVMVLHRNVANFFAGMDERIGAEPGVWLAVTSISFDISVLELFWTLCRGFKVVIQSDESGFRRGQAERASVPRRMDFSLFYFASEAGAARDQYRLLIDGARFADEHGFSAVWTPERHFHAFGGLFSNPSITSAAIAMITKRLQVRAGSVVLPLHHPIRVAEEWALVDNLSNGRAAISFASGWHPNDFALAPANYAPRKQLLYQQIELFQKLWRGETVMMPGGDGKQIPIRIYPQPVQKEIPAWLTSSGDPETFRMAGELGLNVLTHLSGQGMQQLAGRIAIYRKAWQQSGKPGRGQVTVMLHTFVWADTEAAWIKVKKPLKDYLKTYRDLSRNGSGRPANFSGDVESLLNEAVNRYFGMIGLFGPPEGCRKIVNGLRDLGVDEIACLIDFGIDTDSVLTSLRHLNTLKERTNAKAVSGERTYSIAEQLKRHQVTHFQCTPSLMSLVIEEAGAVEALRQLKKIMVGGEAFPISLAERLRGNVTILNMYGPTETAIWSTTKCVDGTLESVPIGRPIANTEIYIVDQNLQPVPVNVAGELLIGGAGVARGYLNRPELTAERFIANPFHGPSSTRLYRTGDLARYLPNGEIECLGRTDHQVKLRGFRIELGEIEAALRLHPAIREAAIVVREVGTNDKRLIAYVTSKTGQRPPVPELKRFVKEKLPDYMVPSLIVYLDQLPLTPNGKIDRKALPNPAPHRAEGEEEFVPAETALEKSIARIWQELLQLERIGLNDNFFEVGGHSLLAAQLQARIGELLQIELPILKLFQYPTISALANFLQIGEPERMSFHKVHDRARRQKQVLAGRAHATQKIAV